MHQVYRQQASSGTTSPGSTGVGDRVQKYTIVRNEGLPDEFELVGTAVGPTAAARELNADPNMRATPAGIAGRL
jgi:hypothetical protein